MLNASLGQEEAFLKLCSKIDCLEELTADRLSNLRILCSILQKLDDETSKVTFLFLVVHKDRYCIFLFANGSCIGKLFAESQECVGAEQRSVYSQISIRILRNFGRQVD